MSRHPPNAMRQSGGQGPIGYDAHQEFPVQSNPNVVLETFGRQVIGVRELLEFDHFVLDEVVGGLSTLADGLENRNRHMEAQSVRNRLAAIRNIRQADSLRPRYAVMFSQCVVLLVSYFSSTVGDLFRAGIASALDGGADVPVREKSVQLTWQRLDKAEAPLPELIAPAVVDTDKIQFQDMQSIARAFEDNLGIKLPRGAQTNDVILGQAARHAIVHNAARVDARMLNQIRAAAPRRLKVTLVLDEEIQFEPDEVTQLADSMASYVLDVGQRVRALTDGAG